MLAALNCEEAALFGRVGLLVLTVGAPDIGDASRLGRDLARQSIKTPVPSNGKPHTTMHLTDFKFFPTIRSIYSVPKAKKSH
jgi:hypothetical protein